MLSAEFPEPTAKTAKAQSRETCPKSHHWVIRDPDAIPRAGKTKKKESTEIRGDQRKKQHASTQTAIGQKIGVGAVGLASKTLSTKPEQCKEIHSKSDQRGDQGDAHGRTIQAQITVSSAVRTKNISTEAGSPAYNN